jgi:hypothetical protein
MSDAPSTDVTVFDIDRLVSGATPQFSQQILERVKALIEPLPADSPVRAYGEQQLVVLERMATATTRGIRRLGVPAEGDEGWEQVPSRPTGGIAPGAVDSAH